MHTDESLKAALQRECHYLCVLHPIVAIKVIKEGLEVCLWIEE